MSVATGPRLDLLQRESSSAVRIPAQRVIDLRDRARSQPVVRRRWTRDLRPIVVALCLLPLITLLLRVVPRLPAAPLLAGYGFLVLTSTIVLFWLAYAKYDDPSNLAPRHRKADADFPRLPTRPSVTLMVAVKDEAAVIERCVRSMTGSDYERLEVIVVDDGSTDGTTATLRRLESELDFRLIALPKNVGKKHALVRAASQASGSILAFTDSDTILAPDAVRRCVAALVADPSLGAVSGHARALNATASFLAKAQDSWYEGSFRVTKAAESTFGAVTCVSGPLAVFRKEAIYNYLPAWANDSFLGQPFRFATDRQLTGYVLGQTWEGERLKRAYADSPFVSGTDYAARRWRVGYVRSAKSWTNVPETLSVFVRQQVRWKKSFVRNLCFTGRFMWRRGIGPAALYYGHALWVLAAPAMAVRHLVLGPAQGLWLLTFLYMGGILVKGTAWGLAYRWDNRGCQRWKYRPMMSLISSVILSWFLPYALLTIRRSVWSRPA
jgi:cellulose synthase/poly-beta-1,6-N-acetylglucosamine synthase-like glycosyltransferase